MKYLLSYKLFEDTNLAMGDNTDAGIITDITDTQVEIDGNWFAKKIVTKIPHTTNTSTVKKIHNRGTIDPNLVISAFTNPIDIDKMDKYTNTMKIDYLNHDFPPIIGYPTIIDENDIGKEFLNGDPITDKDINKYAWIVTDGHHRTVSAINSELPYIETKLDHSYIEDDYYTESVNENTNYLKPELLQNPYINEIVSPENVKEIKKWLSKHKDLYTFDRVRFYHGTGKNLDILTQGLKPTTFNRRRSFQSTSGYVYLACTPEVAKKFGDLGNQSNSIVYCVDVYVRDLKADIDQLTNLRANGVDVGNTLAESIAYGTVRVKGSIPIYNISVYEGDFK